MIRSEDKNGIVINKFNGNEYFIEAGNLRWRDGEQCYYFLWIILSK